MRPASNTSQLSRSRWSFSARRSVSLALPALVALPAHATLLLGCQPSDSVLVCRLKALLTGLETLAGILAILLVVAVLLAVRAYRRKPRKLTPDDITPGAP